MSKKCELDKAYCKQTIIEFQTDLALSILVQFSQMKCDYVILKQDFTFLKNSYNVKISRNFTSRCKFRLICHIRGMGGRGKFFLYLFEGQPGGSWAEVEEYRRFIPIQSIKSSIHFDYKKNSEIIAMKSAPSNRLAYMPTESQRKYLLRNKENENNSMSDLSVEDLLEVIEPDDQPETEGSKVQEKSPPLSGKRLEWVKKELAAWKDRFKEKSVTSIDDCWLRKRVSLKLNAKPDPFDYVPVKFLVWAPRKMGFDCKCVECGHDVVHVKGWVEDPVARRVVDLDDTFYVATQRLECQKSGCKKTFMATDQRLLNQLPHHVQEMFPAVLTARSGMSKALINHIRDMASEGVALDALRKNLEVSHRRKYDVCQSCFLSACLSYKESVEKKRADAEAKRLASTGRKDNPFSIAAPQEIKFEPFVDCQDPEGYGAFWPSTKYITECYVKFIFTHEPSLAAQVVKATLRIASLDHHHGVCVFLNISIY